MKAAEDRKSEIAEEMEAEIEYRESNYQADEREIGRASCRERV